MDITPCHHISLSALIMILSKEMTDTDPLVIKPLNNDHLLLYCNGINGGSCLYNFKEKMAENVSIDWQCSIVKAEQKIGEQCI
jgi:hypothetical protein